MRHLILATLAFTLAGCGIPEGRRLSAMTPAELQGVSDRSLCNFYADSRAVDIERRRRQVRCTNSADNQGNNQWLIDRYERQQREQYQRPQTTNCRNVGGVLHCTTI